MKSLLRNPWTSILVLPAIPFGALMFFRAPPDATVLTFGFLLFMVLAIVASKYVLRAPVLVYRGNINNESVNILGWSLTLVGMMAMQTYRWVYISLERPDWLADTYWSAAFVYTVLYGLILVSWSTRKAIPKQPGGPFSLGGFFIGFLSALGLMLSGALPAATKGILALFGSLTHAL